MSIPNLWNVTVDETGCGKVSALPMSINMDRMKITIDGSEVETIMDFAVVVYTGSDGVRVENRLKGRPRFHTNAPTLVLKEQLRKLLRDDRYKLWTPGEKKEAPKVAEVESVAGEVAGEVADVAETLGDVLKQVGRGRPRKVVGKS